MRRRVLLDEQLPIALRLWLPTVDAFTGAYRGWKGLPDEALLAAARGEIDVLLTFDAALVRERPEWQGICGPPPAWCCPDHATTPKPGKRRCKASLGRPSVY